MFQVPSERRKKVCEIVCASVCICVHACVRLCVTMKHQSISQWLSQLGLPQYCTALEQEYDGVEVIQKHVHAQTNKPNRTYKVTGTNPKTIRNLDEHSKQQMSPVLPTRKKQHFMYAQRCLAQIVNTINHFHSNFETL